MKTEPDPAAMEATTTTTAKPRPTMERHDKNLPAPGIAVTSDILDNKSSTHSKHSKKIKKDSSRKGISRSSSLHGKPSKTASSSTKRPRRRHSVHSRGLVKLDFSHLPLYGRFQEKLSILNTFSRGAGAPAEVIVLFGQIGTGKTTLVNECLSDYTDKHFFGRGKFEQSNLSNKPFAAIVDVFSSLVESIIAQMGQDSYNADDDYPMAVKDALGDEAYRCTTLIPALVDLIGEKPASDDQQEVQCDTTSFMRLLNLLRDMVRAICAFSIPVVLFFDDLQFADSDSLRLFKYLANDREVTNLVVIGSYEDDEKSGFESVALILEEIDLVKTTLMRLDNLQERSVNHLIADVMAMSTDLTKDLAKMVYKRSGGNPFLMIQFLELIQELGLLAFDTESKQWIWKLKTIKQECALVDGSKSTVRNLQYVVSGRISHLPNTAKLVLSTAASLGSSFFDLKVLSWLLKDKKLNSSIGPASVGRSSRSVDSASTFMSAMMASFRGLESGGNPESDIRDSLLALEKIGMVDRIDLNRYRFTHDRIQLGAYFLLPEGKNRDTKHWKTGQYLKRLLDKRILEDDWLFFTMVDQLNKGCSCITDDEERMEVSALNLRAAYKARERSAFAVAAKYAYYGISYLEEETKWTVNRTLSLKLMNLASEMALSSGDYESSLDASQEVIENGAFLEEKIPGYLLHMKALTESGNSEGAVKIGLIPLSELGEKFTSKPSVVNAVLNLSNLKGSMQNISDEKLLELPPMTDELKVITMQMLALVSQCAAVSKTKEYVPLFRCRMVHLTIKSGICDESVLALTGYGMLNATLLNGHDDAYRFGNLGLQLQQLRNCMKYSARVSFEFYGYTHHIKEPIRSSLMPLHQSFKKGIRYGCIEDALMAASVHCSHYLCCGRPLLRLSDSLRECLGLMLDYEPTLYLSLVPLGQLIKNLMGKAPNSIVLNGDVMDLDTTTAQIASAHNLHASRSLLAAQVELACWFREYKAAHGFLKQIAKLKQDPDFQARFASRRLLFYEGLVNVGLSREHGKGTYIRNARACVKKMQKFAVQGSPDCAELLQLLEAEVLSLNAKANPVDVMIAYQSAISSSVHSGSHQNIALANELAGRFQKSINDDKNAIVFLAQAHMSYSEWNAYEKAHELVRAFPELEEEAEAEMPSESSKRSQTDLRVVASDLTDDYSFRDYSTPPFDRRRHVPEVDPGDIVEKVALVTSV